MKSSRSAAALTPEREGILAVLTEQSTIERIQGVIRELQLDDELTVTDTLDSALRRIRSGPAPRILLVDLGESTAPIAEVSAARTVGGSRSEARRARHGERRRSVPRPALGRRQ
jgi:hypothetical protein